ADEHHGHDLGRADVELDAGDGGREDDEAPGRRGDERDDEQRQDRREHAAQEDEAQHDDGDEEEHPLHRRAGRLRLVGVGDRRDAARERDAQPCPARALGQRVAELLV
ncbi:MAG: hypothetical protein AVDCRST_MAG79-2918, partial [uncultured Thermoleophilia bacterium]